MNKSIDVLEKNKSRDKKMEDKGKEEVSVKIMDSLVQRLVGKGTICPQIFLSITITFSLTSEKKMQ